MSTLNLKKERLSNLFDCKKGNNKYTKTYCNKHHGEYEVYTGSTLKSFGFLNTYDYDKQNLSFTTDGEYAGTLKVLSGKYNVGGHRAILLKKDSNLNLDYFKYILQPIFYSRVKPGDVPSVSWEKHLKDIEIEIPINKDGDYDIEEQSRIAKILKQIENEKIVLQKKKNRLLSTLIKDNLLENFNASEYNLTDYFIPQRGNSKYTKTYCQNNPGEYPVFSANNSAPLGYRSTYDYDGIYLTISVNGIAGKITKKEGKFSINADRVILIPKNNAIDLDYIRYSIEPILRSKVKGRKGHDGQNEFTKLPFEIIEKIKIKIPINNDRELDIAKQKEIANKYRKIEEIKRNISTQIDMLCSTEIKL